VKYEIRDGKETYHGIKADVLGSELERIRKEKGGYLRTADVVEEAEAKSNPLHDCFEWDDSSAGHQYRMQQARQLIRVVHIPDDGPAFFNIRIITVKIESNDDDEETEDTEQVYQSSKVLRTRPDELQSALDYLKGKMASAIRAYEDAKILVLDSAKEKQMKLVGDHLQKAQKAAARI